MKVFGLPLSSQHFLALVVATLLASGGAVARSVTPFGATIAITESVHQVGSLPCILVGDISGKGVATNLGVVNLVSHDCINPISATEFSFSSDQLELTAANGDKIFAAYGGILSATTGLITGGYLIVGGTGRFSKATGAGTIQGLEEINLGTGTGTGQIKLIGTISY
jgi:hypothetical protein